mmetsp:Transcript_14544/g.33933  ORF Transcript_14544/g.33933 Transcript_14544/m.33933 type:complete len:315 (+) Transcript_14544:7081-8025(+)
MDILPRASGELDGVSNRASPLLNFEERGSDNHSGDIVVDDMDSHIGAKLRFVRNILGGHCVSEAYTTHAVNRLVVVSHHIHGHRLVPSQLGEGDLRRERSHALSSENVDSHGSSRLARENQRVLARSGTLPDVHVLGCYNEEAIVIKNERADSGGFDVLVVVVLRPDAQRDRDAARSLGDVVVDCVDLDSVGSIPERGGDDCRARLHLEACASAENSDVDVLGRLGVQRHGEAGLSALTDGDISFVNRHKSNIVIINRCQHVEDGHVLIVKVETGHVVDNGRNARALHLEVIDGVNIDRLQLVPRGSSENELCW